MNKLNELILSCPFCAEKPEISEYESTLGAGENKTKYSLVCKCGLSLFKDDKKELLDYWNTRKGTDKLVESLEKKYDEILEDRTNDMKEYYEQIAKGISKNLIDMVFRCAHYKEDK